MTDPYEIDLDRYDIMLDELDGAQESRCTCCNRLMRTDQLRYGYSDSDEPLWLCPTCSRISNDDTRPLPSRRRIPVQ